MNKHYDYIIVGQGLAGSVLAHTLLKKKKSILIIDDATLSQSSNIAAGLYNPVVFKRLVKSWMVDELIPTMDEFYVELETLLDTKFYFKKSILKPFAEEQEKVLWLKKANEDVGKYLNKTIEDRSLDTIIYNSLGAGEVIGSGNLDPTLFLKSSRNYFQKSGSLINERFNYDQLQISTNQVSYNNSTADKIIFCEGYKAIDNPYFKWLPFKLTKGEILTIRLKEEHLIPFDKVINKGLFILPIGNNIYKVGATYEWNDLKEEITAKGKSELVEKLSKVLRVPFEIINHQAGIRPTVNDRRPLIGIHPQHVPLIVFNGMGTKVVMLAPYFAKQLVAFLENKTPLHPEVDITRFK
jgi:glycine oxidase